MPSPFSSAGEGTGGDENAAFYQPCIWCLDSISGELIKLVDYDTFKEWCDSDNALTASPDDLIDYLNVYSFIMTFDISYGDAKEALKYELESDGDDEITYEQLDIIYSGDLELITATFASDYSIVKGDKIYNVFWVYYHSIEDYEAVGITPEDILSRVELYSEFNYSDEARAAFEAKLSEFTGTEVSLPAPVHEYVPQEVTVIESEGIEVPNDELADVIEVEDVYVDLREYAEKLEIDEEQEDNAESDGQVEGCNTVIE